MPRTMMTVSIDPDIAKRAKILIPNLSEFVEEAFRKKIYGGEDPEKIEEKIEKLKKEIAFAQERLNKVTLEKNVNLTEAVQVCSDLLKTKGEIPEKTLVFWSSKANVSTDALTKAVFDKFKKKKVKK